MKKNFIIYDATGVILRAGSCDEIDFELQASAGEFLIEGSANCDVDAVDVQTRTVIVGGKPAVLPPAAAPETYLEIRSRLYPSVGDQLDMLWHAMDQDVSARIEPFYSMLKSVKDTVPKTSEHIFDVGSL